MVCVYIADTNRVCVCSALSNGCSFIHFSFAQHSIHMVVVFVMIEMVVRHFVDCNFVLFVSHLDFDCLMKRIVVDTLGLDKLVAVLGNPLGLLR